MSGSSGLRGRDLVGIADLAPAELERLLDRAAELKAELRARREHRDRPLRNRTVALIFEKPSLRTRVTFETGILQLGGHPVDLASGEIGLGVRESVRDIARNLSRWVDAIVVRTFAHAVVEELAAEADVPVINALTDLEHPCQALADLLTLRERFGRTAGLVVAYVGDPNNVYHSLLLAGVMSGLEVRLARPPGYEPDPGILARAERLAAAGHGRVILGHDPRAVVRGADVVYTDTWISMGREAEAAERRRAFAGYRVDAALLDTAGPETLVMHCLPAHRGEEITADVLDGPRSIVLDQAENRLHAQKAFLAECLGDG
ncbi:MAG TPA: ornithine carbamoyltransferase [Candidatus Limnocylindrales bacterium]|nr:ornithine carbamoyltransferase [Candidatus Limnocylindrales bacterium]